MTCDITILCEKVTAGCRPQVNFLDPRLPDRFWDKCIPEPNSGCWLWIGAKQPLGYGSMRIERVTLLSHVIAYTALVGPVMQDFELDHLCRTPDCCNPAHLEPVTHQVNMLRGDTVAAANARKTHCPQGHPYDRLYGQAKRTRRCSACASDRDRTRYSSRAKGRSAACSVCRESGHNARRCPRRRS